MASVPAPETKDVISSKLAAVLEEVEIKYPARWRDDCWYLTAAAALVGSGCARDVGQLYAFLVQKPRFQTSQQRQHLVRRLREALIKCIILNGIPAVIEAIISIGKLEKDEDKDYTFTREGWQPDRANYDQGLNVLEFLYREDHARIMSLFDAHRDIRMYSLLAFISTEISYGLFLSNHKILNLQESELVVLPAIMSQNLRDPTSWHLRGCVRTGIPRPDVELVQQCIELIAEYAGRKLDNIQRVTDVED